MFRRPQTLLLLATTAFVLTVGCATSDEQRYGAELDTYEVRVGKSMSARYERPWYGGEHKLKIERTTPDANASRTTSGAGTGGAK